MALFPLYLIFVVSSVYAEDEDLSEARCSTYQTLASLPNPFGTVGKVCCERIGCFSNEKSTKWSRLSELPDCIDKIKPNFVFYSPDGDSNQTVDFFNLNSSVKTMKIDSKKELYVIIHGWRTKWPNNRFFPMKDALLDLNANVLLVQWTDGSNVSNYIKAAANVRSIAAAVAVVLKEMVTAGKLRNFDTVTLIGFSLGAHAAGLAGAELPGLKRIIGLDPAGPLFACEDPETRLDQTDAKFVQIFHTNGETVLKFGHGTMQPMGHVDFYVNGGQFQPDCDQGLPQRFRDVFSINLTAVYKSMSCSHHRASSLLIEMLKQEKIKDSKEKCTYITFPCNDSTSWVNGECFSIPSEGSPQPGYRLDYGSKFHGKYFFNVQYGGESNGQLCGLQYLISLTSDVEIKGAINLTFVSSIGDNATVNFQKQYDTMPGNKPVSRVITLPRYFNGLNGVYINYNKYTSRLWKDGEEKFAILNATITSTEGKSFHTCAKSIIQNQVPTKFTFDCQ